MRITGSRLRFSPVTKAVMTACASVPSCLREVRLSLACDGPALAEGLSKRRPGTKGREKFRVYGAKVRFTSEGSGHCVDFCKV